MRGLGDGRFSNRGELVRPEWELSTFYSSYREWLEGKIVVGGRIWDMWRY